MIRIVAWLLLLRLPLQQAPTPPAPDPPLRTAPLGEPDEPTPTEAPRHLLPAGTLCARAEQLFDDGGGEALKGAGKLFGIAASRFPHEPCGHAGLARTLVASYSRRIEPDDTQVTEALEAARRAVSLAPDSPLARAALATALFADLRPIEAERQASSALGLDPDSIPALLAAAQARIALSRHADAREALDRALRIAPALPAAHLLEGHLHLVQGSAHDAVDSYSRALLLSPDYLPALLQLAVALTEAGRAAEASAAFRQIVEENPGESSRANLLMAHALMKSGVWAPALKLLERTEFTTLRGLSNGTVHYMRGVCLEQLGRSDEAKASYRALVDGFPDATGGFGSPRRLIFPAYEALARIALSAKDYEGAVAVMEEGTRRPDASIELHLRLARLYQDYRMDAEAQALLERAVDRPVAARDAAEHLSAYIEWARLAARRSDAEALGRMTASLQSRRVEFEALKDFARDIEAMRALSIAGRGEAAMEWLRHAVGLGYAQLAWIERDSEMQPLRAAPGYREISRTPEPAAGNGSAPNRVQ